MLISHGVLGDTIGVDVARVVSSVVGMVEGPVLVGVPTVIVGTVWGVVFKMGVPGEVGVVPEVEASGPGVLPEVTAATGGVVLGDVGVLEGSLVVRGVVGRVVDSVEREGVD